MMWASRRLRSRFTVCGSAQSVWKSVVIATRRSRSASSSRRWSCWCPRSRSSRAVATAERVVPRGLECIRDQAIAWVDQHEASLREIGVDLGSLDRATPQLIRLLMPHVDLAADLERQLDGGGRHLCGDQRPDRLVDGRPRNRLAVRLGATALRTVADVPGLQPSAPRRVSDAEVSAASPAHRAALQQRRALAPKHGSWLNLVETFFSNLAHAPPRHSGGLARRVGGPHRAASRRAQ